jgi:intein-encoded DNA endonuclease-like protein
MGLFRKCQHGYDIKLYHGLRFLPKAVLEGRKKGMKYFLVVDGELIKQSSKLSIIENAYIGECKKKHKPTEKHTGRFGLLRHKLKGGVVVPR